MAQQPAQEPTTTPIQAGKLTPSTLPALIHSLFADQATGLLTLRDGDLQKTV